MNDRFSRAGPDNNTMRIGVISDTHGHLDPKVREIFADVDHILHAGDMGFPSIVMELEDLAPVTAVLGNTDDPRTDFREMEVVELGGLKFLLQHIVDPQAPSERIQQAFLHHAPDVVIFGHTHKPFHEVIGGRLFLNPGYAGRGKVDERRSVAVIRLEDGGVELDLLDL
jgi:putative phosphoesterase